VAPQRVDRLMSQIDLAPTLLGLLNFSYPSKFYGFDLFQLEPGRERAFISTYQSLGYLSAERLVLLDPRRRTQTFAVNLAAATSTPVSNDAALIEDAVSWYQSSSRAFKSGQMR
jgi:phosphoglycerol transferase MdoB-like AlkP superfamily enzyme